MRGEGRRESGCTWGSSDFVLRFKNNFSFERQTRKGVLLEECDVTGLETEKFMRLEKILGCLHCVLTGHNVPDNDKNQFYKTKTTTTINLFFFNYAVCVPSNNATFASLFLCELLQFKKAFSLQLIQRLTGR